MRILTICGDRGVPAFGRKGASTHLREMIGGLREKGHEVLLCAANLDGDRGPDEDFQTIGWKTPTARILGYDLRSWISDRRAYSTIDDAIRRFKPDAIYERLSIYFTSGDKLARRYRLPRIVEVNALLSDEQANRVHFLKWAQHVEYGVVRRAPALAAVSTPMRDRLIEVGADPKTIRILSMAVNPARFAHRGQGPARRAQAGLPEQATILAFIGSMNHYHKPSLFFDCIGSVLEEHPNVYVLVIGGADNKRERFAKQCAKWVANGRMKFLGTVPQSEFSDWLEAIDLIVVPGGAPQSTPTKVYETAAKGRPLLLPDIESLRQLTAGGAESLIVKGGTVEALGAAVRKWLANPAAYIAANAKLRENVVTNHTWHHHAQKVVDWFEEQRVALGRK